MLGYGGPVPGSAGASSVIYGLLAISLVWAPRNEVTCVTIIFFRMVYIFENSIVAFAGFYFGSQMLMAGLVDFAMSSAVIHLLGAATGFGVGVLMLKMNWVDCENWDLFAVMAGTHGGLTELEPYRYREATWLKSAQRADRRRASENTGWNLT